MSKAAQKVEPVFEEPAVEPVVEAVPVAKSLDERVAEMLAAPDDIASIVFADLLTEVAAEIARNDQLGRDARARMIDPTVIDAGARGRAEDSEFRAARLRNSEAAIRPHLAAALAREEVLQWRAEAELLGEEVLALAIHFKRRYLACGGELVGIFKAMKELDRRSLDLNVRSPAGYNTLPTVEALARDIDRVRDKPLIDQVVLPGFCSFETYGHAEIIWPPQGPSFAAEMARLTSSAAANARPPLTDAEKLENARKQVAQWQEQEAGRIAKNEEADRRARSHEAEQRRLAAGEL